MKLIVEIVERLRKLIENAYNTIDPDMLLSYFSVPYVILVILVNLRQNF